MILERDRERDGDGMVTGMGQRYGWDTDEDGTGTGMGQGWSGDEDRDGGGNRD